ISTFVIGISTFSRFVFFSTTWPLKSYKNGPMRRVCFAVLVAIPITLCAEPSPAPNHIVSRIPRQAVQSTVIAKVGYSKRRHILEIEFVNGAIYRYLDVAPSVYHDLMLADSKA